MVEFDALCDRLAEMFPPADVRISQRESAAVLQISVGGIQVLLMHFPDIRDESATLLVELGPVRDAQAWGTLLDANHTPRDPRAPRFARDPVSHHAILQCEFGLVTTTASEVRTLIMKMMGMTRDWNSRQDLP